MIDNAFEDIHWSAAQPALVLIVSPTPHFIASHTHRRKCVGSCEMQDDHTATLPLAWLVSKVMFSIDVLNSPTQSNEIVHQKSHRQFQPPS